MNVEKTSDAAKVRHAETNYDELLLSMVERSDARAMVHDAVEEVLEQWEGSDVRT